MDGAAADADALPARVAAFLPRDLLQGGETVLLLLKPSPLYIVLASLRGLALIAGGAALLTALNNARIDLTWLGLGYRSLETGVSSRDVILAGAGVAGLRLCWQLVEWLARTYVLTDRRVIRIRGVFTVSIFQAPLVQVQHTDVSFTLRERLFGLGTIAISTAGTGAREAYWVMLDKPLEVHRTLLDALRRYGRG